MIELVGTKRTGVAPALPEPLWEALSPDYLCTKPIHLDNTAPDQDKAPPHRLQQAGERLNGHIEIVQCIGVGGMSAVYKAIDHRQLKAGAAVPFIAVKVFRPPAEPRGKWVERLYAEARRCQALQHPNIVRVYDVTHDGPTVYLTMEYLAGATLAQRIRTEHFRGLPKREALQIIRAMGQALDFSHANGIAHSDFKPANIFLTNAGDVKLIDFGMARPIRGSRATGNAGADETAGVAAATAAYASPEMLTGAVADPRDDVYALACTAYELLTGHHPFDYQAGDKACTMNAPVKSHQHLAWWQHRALARALAFDRQQRTATVTQLLNELDAQDVWTKRLLAASIILTASVFLYTISSNPDGVENEGANPDSAPIADSASAPETAPSANEAKLRAITSNPEPRQPGLAATDPAKGNKPAASQAGSARVGSAFAVTRPGQASDIAGPDRTRSADPDENAAATATADTLAQKAEASPSPTTALEQTLNTLLASGQRQMLAKRYLAPRGDSALESYRAALKLMPDNATALQRIKDMKAFYKGQAERALAARNWSRAQAQLDRALKVDNKDRELQRLKQELDVKAAHPAQQTNTKPALVSSTRVETATAPTPTQEQAPAGKSLPRKAQDEIIDFGTF